MASATADSGSDAAASADADTGDTSIPGDFGETLFNVAREVVDNKCDVVFDDYCKRVEEACTAASKEGNMQADMPPIALTKLESAIFLEKLHDRYNKCGVHAAVEVGRGEHVMPGVGGMITGIVFIFSWSCTNQSEGGRLQPLNPEQMTLVKPAGGETFAAHGPNSALPLYRNAAAPAALDPYARNG